jgi:hypothetical protein
MKQTLILRQKEIRNYKDGLNLNSKYWQDWKKKLPPISSELREIAIGMILPCVAIRRWCDACMYKKSKHSLIKFEQGYTQEKFLNHLFSKFKSYCFMEEPGKRIELYGERKGLIKSLWFKTFSHYSFDDIWNLFYIENKDKYKVIKTIQKGLILNQLTDKGLAYWVMGDGSLQKDKKTMILHTQSFNENENLILSKELNKKFNFKTEVKLHKKFYWVIKFYKDDALILHNLIKPHITFGWRYMHLWHINYLSLKNKLKIFN